MTPPVRKGLALTALACGSLVLALNLGIRQSLGIFIPDMMSDSGWNAGTFALAFALQNLLWGLVSPVAGALADRYGTARTLLMGTLLYALGLTLMGLSTTPWLLYGSGGVLIGIGVGATTFPVVLGAIGRAVSDSRRSFALGVASAGGSLGFVVMAPVTEILNQQFGWSNALFLIAAISLFMAPAGAALAGRAEQEDGAGEAFALGDALRYARSHRGYRLLNFGFFVCGFHVAFIAVHLPTFVQHHQLPPPVAAQGLALIGLFNIAGTLVAGTLGGRYRKKWLLSALYGARGLLILTFFFLPKTTTTVLVFSALIGLLWLSTVPLTSGVVAQIFGARFLATLFGIVMLSHQIGAFFGSWLGGVVYDATGSFEQIWILAAGLSFFAMAVHLPIDDQKLDWKQPALRSPAA